MLHVFRLMLQMFPVMLQETRATLQETPATLQETSATLHETRATVHETRPRPPSAEYTKPTMLRSIRVIEVITHNITFPRITFRILLP